MAVKQTGSERARSVRPGPRPAPAARAESGLTAERIAAAAVELLDVHGVDGLTMRALADALGSGVMSVYWHVDGKDDVFDLALDAALAYRGPPQSPGGLDWRAEVVHLLEDWRASMLRHPWSVLLLPRRALGDGILGRLELLGMALSRAGVAEADLNVAIWTLWNFVMGATVSRASFELTDGDRAASQQRLTHRAGRYPTIQASGLLLDSDWDGAFRKGLDFLLDGMAPRRLEGHPRLRARRQRPS